MICGKKIIGFFFFFTLVNPGFCQQYFFSDYSIEKGLSQSVVNCLFQDSEGYIWIGTQNGLNKFNGYNFEIYTPDPSDTNSISNNWIYCIDEDNQGNLWVGTKNGLNRFIRKEKRFERIHDPRMIPNILTGPIYDVLVSRDGNIVINTPPVLTIYNPGKKEFKRFPANLEYDGAVKDNTMPLLEDASGLIWIGSTKGLSCFDRKTGKFSYFLPERARNGYLNDRNITALYEDKQGRIWVGTSNGLYVYNKNTRTFVKFVNDPKDEFSLSNNFIRAITEDLSGNIWIGTEGGGLNKMNPSKTDRPVFEAFTNESSGLSHNIVLSLEIDHSDNLWIGTLKGINKTDLKKQKFRLYRKGTFPYSLALLGNVVASIYKDERGIIWIGNWGQGLNLYDRKSGKVEHFSTRFKGIHNIPNDFVHVIFEDADQRVWIGTRDGILIYDKIRNTFIRFEDYFIRGNLPDFRGIRVNMIIQDKKKNYWIGTPYGVYKFNLADGSSEHFQEESAPDHQISANLIYSLLEDREGLIWIATTEGLDVYHPDTKRITHYRKNNGSSNSLADDFIISLCEDHEGSIWIGTSSYINKFVKKDSVFIYFSQKDGLPNNQIFEILEDNRNHLWVATGNGLCRFDSSTNTFRTYSIEDGLQSLEFNLRARYKSKDGEMFFGGMNGFNSFYPDSLSDNPFIPQVVFSSFYKTNNRGVNEHVDVDNVDEILLKHSDQSFTIEFAALEFTYPGKNQFAYRMQGISDEWIKIGNRRFVPFSNLPPGEYTFAVKCSNNDGIWNETGKSLKIIISPPWWRSRIAYIAYFLTIVVLIILYIRWRERKLVRERNILEEKVAIRTVQIERQNKEILDQNEKLNGLNKELKELNATKDKFFSIIAHDLRNPFNTILGLSDMLLINFKNYEPGKIQKSISDIKDASRHTYDLLENLLIWARSQTGILEFKPVVFNLCNRIADTIDLLAGQAKKKNIRILSTVEGDCFVTGDLNMIDAVLRNLITNAIKFTPKDGQVVVSVKQSASHYDVSVRDTGVGIANENIQKLFRIEGKYARKGTDQERGSGLGLILCKEFIEKHGGSIWVDSTLGQGSDFRFTLPKGA